MNKQFIANNIRYIRKQKGLSQAELGKLMNVSAPTVAGWESCRVTVKIETIEKLCNVLECSEDAIMGFNDKNNALAEEKLLGLFNSLSEDHKHLLLVRAKELQNIEKEERERNIKRRAA